MTNYKSKKNEIPVVLANGSTVPLVGIPSMDPERDDYDPFEHRKLAHATTDGETLVHLLKGSLGSGILAMPLAFSNAGLGFGLIGTIAVGMICTYCVHMLVKSAHELYKRNRVPSMSFAEVAQAAFLAGPDYMHKWSRLAKALINIFLVVDLLGCCCVYSVFVAKQVKQVVDFYSDVHLDIRIYLCMLLPFLILMNLIRNLKYLAPLSLIANCLVAVGMGTTFYYIFSDLPDITTRPQIVDVTRWPMFFGTAIFALEGVGVVMSLENNMKTPRHFIGCPGVLNISMSIVIAFYASVGFLGFWKYGAETEGSITLNLPHDQMLSQSVKIMIAIAISFTYCLQFYVPMEIILRSLRDRYGSIKDSTEYLLRTSVVIGTVVIAILVPNLGGFISLVGAVCLSVLGLIFPALIELLTFHDSKGLGKCRWRLWKNVAIIIFGIIGFFTGAYVSVVEIIIDLS